MGACLPSAAWPPFSTPMWSATAASWPRTRPGRSAQLPPIAARNADLAQVETGSSITWKYPSVILQGDNSVGEFYSVALVNNYQQADTGTKMIHLGKNTKSTIVAKGISAGHGQNTYRGLVKIMPSAKGARNFTQCDSLLIGLDGPACPSERSGSC